MNAVSAWRRRVDAIMTMHFAITVADAGLSDEELLRHFRSEPDAAAFVNWFGQKYDLDRVPSFRGVSSIS